MKIYTKKGDTGTTQLIGGTRVPKHHIRIECYGTVDELNSTVGLVADAFTHEHSRQVLKEVQDRLFTIGSLLASDPEKARMTLPDLFETDIELLEKEIDAMNAVLPEQRHFILPGGHIAVSYMHIARCVCRRAERLATHLAETDFVEPLVIKYLNRLSDYLFVLARFAGQQLGAAELAWHPRVSK